MTPGALRDLGGITSASSVTSVLGDDGLVHRLLYYCVTDADGIAAYRNRAARHGRVRGQTGDALSVMVAPLALAGDRAPDCLLCAGGWWV